MGSLDRTVKNLIGDALFGATRQAVLRLLFSHPDQRFYQRQIIQTIDLGSGTVQRELQEFTRAGILRRTVEGHQVYFQANRQCQVFEDLRGLVRKTFGVSQVLQNALESLERKIHVAFVYGSLAASVDKPASDLDVLVVSDTLSFEKLVSVLAGAQRELRREINPSIYGVEEFYRKLGEGQHFVSSVVAGPKLFLVGDESEFTRLVKERLAQRTSANGGGDRRSFRHC